MRISKQEGPAAPTIGDVLEEFLDEQEERLSRRTFSQYSDVIELLQHSLNGYAYSYLGDKETAYFDRLRTTGGGADLQFCEVFGPEHILGNVDEFLSYFMVRKVMASKELLRAAGTVTKKLARWLQKKGYAEAEEAEEACELGAEAARALPAAEELVGQLDELAEYGGLGEPAETVEGHFSITRVQRNRIWLQNILGGREPGPIELPSELAARCRVGWRISGVVGRFGRRWGIVEVWNVYPL